VKAKLVYTSITFTERLTAAGVSPSVRTVGDAYDNALAESVIGLFKTELIKPCGPWRTAEQVEIATLGYVDWFNHRRSISGAIRRRCQRRTVPGVISRCLRNRAGRTRISAARTARSGQSSGGRPGAAQYRNLVPQDEQFGHLGRCRAAEQDQPAAGPGEHQVKQTDGHDWPSCSPRAASVVPAQERCGF
jgi:hypothetical protein